MSLIGPPPLFTANIVGGPVGLIDIARVPVNFHRMDLDEILPKRAGDPLNDLMRQDLDPFSVTELEARIAALEAEIARTRGKMQRAVNHRASADDLFKR